MATTPPILPAIAPIAPDDKPDAVVSIEEVGTEGVIDIDGEVGWITVEVVSIIVEVTTVSRTLIKEKYGVLAADYLMDLWQEARIH
jgi:hypothetical protein